MLRRNTHRCFRPRFVRLESRLAPATFTVSNISDGAVTKAGDLPGSLRQALFDANAAAGTDTVLFDASFFGTARTITLGAVLPDITGNANFVGTTAANVKITRTAGTFRIFNSNITGTGLVSFSNITITGGNAAANGAGIFAGDDIVSLNNCVLSNNFTLASGGGIAVNAGGTINLTNSTISGNTASLHGGGVYANGTLVTYGSLMTGNSAADSTGGGGVAVNAGATTIRNSTISGNHSTGGPGGGVTLFGGGTVTIQNSTIAFNDAKTNGGGINRTAGTVSIESTIVAKNTAVTIGDDVNGSVSFAKFDLIGEIDGSTGITDPSNKTGTKATPLNPVIGSLADNGGRTQTHALLGGSPCINTGSNPAGLATDQRNAPILRVWGGQADIGAFETSLAVASIGDTGVDTLRNAIAVANFQPGADTITFDSTFFGSSQTITLTTGEMAISEAVAITGPAATLVTVNGNGLGRAFNTSNAGTGAAISISGLTLTNCKTSGFGGAILAGDESLTLNGCVLTGNSSTSNSGGAVAVTAAGSFIANDCSLTSNSAFQTGGAITMFGIAGAKTILQRCAISGNTANRAGGLYAGNYLLMTNSTVAGNKATGARGGGVEFFGPGGAGSGITIQNCTISGNSSFSDGGGIVLTLTSGTMLVQNSTITANTANSGGGKAGGGIARYLGAISLESSIVSGNVNPLGPDVYSGGSVTAKFCAIGSATGLFSFAPDATTTRLLGANLKLGALANNGGTTFTQLPAADSPVIGQGSNTIGLSLDQRGLARTVGAQIDIGAVEVQNILPLVVFQNGDVGNGSLRQAVADANVLPGADAITFDPTFFATAQTITLTNGEIAISAALTITGPGASLATVSGNSTSRAFNAFSAPAPVSISGLTISSGKMGGAGGAIVAGSEALALNGCVLTGNSSTAAGGGAVAVVSGGSLTATDCSFTNNSAAGVGGALDVFGPGAKTILQRCTISGNSGTNGGGVYSVVYLLVENSTLSGNNATNGRGGAVFLEATAGSAMTIRNSTITGNSSTNGGGGIVLNSFNGIATVTFQNSTITGNVTTGGTGGGFDQVNGTGAISLESCIVSGNTNAAAPDIFSSGPVNVKTSAIGSYLGLSGFVDQGGNLPFGANLKLGTLSNNGGSTQTILPAIDSPLVNAGSNPSGQVNDQRGAGFSRSRFGVDIGAVEATTNFVVTNANDSGAGSLRQAIADANLFATVDTITFDPNFFNSAKTISLTTGELLITDSVNIVGPGAALATVSGNNADRVFDLQSAPAAAPIGFSGLTITGGKIASLGGAILGGDESITLAGCVLTGNSATAGAGGAVAIVAGGTLVATDSSFTNNSSSSGGGAFAVFGGTAPNTVLNRSTVSGNTASVSGGFYAQNYLLMMNTTVAMNKTTAGRGGGFYFEGSGSGGSGITVQNCTISGNSSATGGGGIVLLMSAGTMVVQNSTITANTAASQSGGGIARFNGSALISLESTIVSGNTNASAPDIFTSGAVAAKNCAIGSNTGITTFFNQGGNLANGTNLKLGSLGDNGGPTLTQIPAPDSPLVNAGSNPANLVNDQRGAGFPRGINGGVDIGATESFMFDKLAPVVNSVTPSALVVGDAQVGFQGFSLMVTFNEPMDQTVNPTISFPNTNPGGSLAFTGGAWLNATQFQTKYDVQDLNVTINAIDVRVVGGQDLAGNVEIILPVTAAKVFSIDTQNPIVVSMTRNNPSLTNLATVGWTVTFSEPVTGVNAGDFTLFNGGLGGSPAVNSVTGGGTSWIVTATGYAGQGTIALYVTGTTGVGDLASNPLAALPVIGPAYSIDAIPPTVTNVQINDGSAQRSRVTSITVTFIEPVYFANGPTAVFTLTGPNGPVTLSADASGSTPVQTIVRLTFSGANTDFTSLKDGRYTLGVLASQVTDLVGNLLDGNGDGTAGDDYQLIGTPANGLFRLFGDVDGNGVVNAADFLAFRSAFGGSSIAFDFNNSGTVDTADFLAFRSRFGSSV